MDRSTWNIQVILLLWAQYGINLAQMDHLNQRIEFRSSIWIQDSITLSKMNLLFTYNISDVTHNFTQYGILKRAY